MIESGYPQVGFHPDAWMGLLAPAGTPGSVVGLLNREVNESLKMPQIKDAFEKLDIEPMPMSPAEFATFLASEFENWPPRLRGAGIKPD